MRIQYPHPKIFIAALLLLFLHAVSALAIEEEVHFYRGIRSAGMGGIITTTGNYDEALYGNPARHVRVDAPKLDLLNVTFEANSNFASGASNITDALSSSGSSVALVSKASSLIGQNEHMRLQNLTGYYNPEFYDSVGFAVGFLTSLQANLLVLPSTDIDTQAILDTGVSFGLANTYYDGRLSLGINVHTIYRVGTDQVVPAVSLLAGQSLRPHDYGHQGVGIDGDLGAYYKIPWEPRFMRLNVGASLNNFLQSTYAISQGFLYSISGNPPRDDRTLNLGLRADFPDTDRFKATLLAVEVHEIGSLSKEYTLLKRIHIGGETKPWRRIAVRAGLYQGYPSAGVGIDLSVLKIDLATYSQEIGAFAGDWEDRRYLVRFALEL